MGLADDTATRVANGPWHTKCGRSVGVGPQPFHSILFDRPSPELTEVAEPDCFVDLNLDQVVGSITAGLEQYELESYFHKSLRDVDGVTYRHEVFRDLQRPELSRPVRSFADQMSGMRGQLAQARELHYHYQKERWMLDAVQTYCAAIQTLSDDLDSAQLDSSGFTSFRGFVAEYVKSDEFVRLRTDTADLEQQLTDITYCVHIRANRVRVTKYSEEADYATEVLATFEKFKQREVEEHKVQLRDSAHMNHVEAQVLDRVARLFPEVFSALDNYCQRHRDFVHETIRRFDREVEFYLAYLRRMGSLTRTGLEFCYPRVSSESKDIEARGTFDIALAGKLVHDDAQVVCNDFDLTGSERVFVVSGPNQGGKTTFARTFGQLHYLAALGCPVPGKSARLFLCDQLFTHFEKQEDLSDLRGKLQDDLVRIHHVIDRATPRSIVIMNEIFTSTTLEDALFLGREVLRRLIDLELLCVCVTFLEELAALSDTTVSMVSTVVPEDPAIRTFKVVRRPADGRSYAIVIAEKYGLTYERLRERIAP